MFEKGYRGVDFILCAKGQRQHPPLGLATLSNRQGGLPITAQGLGSVFLCLGSDEMTRAIVRYGHLEGHISVLGPWVERPHSHVFSLVPDSLSNDSYFRPRGNSFPTVDAGLGGPSLYSSPEAEFTVLSNDDHLKIMDYPVTRDGCFIFL